MGFEPTCSENHDLFSRQSRYDHFGISPKAECIIAYFIVCNQFKKHKNHTKLLAWSLRDVVKEKLRYQVVRSQKPPYMVVIISDITFISESAKACLDIFITPFFELQIATGTISCQSMINFNKSLEVPSE